ncbi:MAG: hypothetical protein M1839_007141 [Geoglossum umbratile]|nr:MAG: hypothetical protein M1839_007141 [Geoglossum umbratile]
MSTTVYPPLPAERLLQEEKDSISRELEWLLESLQETLASLRLGLEECIALLEPTEPGCKLVLSSHRSESLKGTITRVGTRVVACDVQVKMHGLAPTKGYSCYKLAVAADLSDRCLVLDQLAEVRNLVNQSLDVVDVSTWTGDPKDANFISGQLRLLYDNMQEARQALKVTDSNKLFPHNPVDARIFDHPLPENLSFDLSISDASLRVELRTLEPVKDHADTLANFGFQRLAAAIGAARKPEHDESNEVFCYRGVDVRVKEKIRVESADPSLIALMAKLAALEHNVSLSRKALDIVMGRDE